MLLETRKKNDRAKPTERNGAAHSFTANDLWRITVKQYHDMIDQGVFANDEKIELLDGVLVKKMGYKPAHQISARKTRDALARSIPKEWDVDYTGPVSTEDSEPEPDIFVFRGKRQDYPTRHPGPDEVGLLVEVSDSSLQRDRGIKMAVYARAGFPFYWIINLRDRVAEVYSQPTASLKSPKYRRRQIFGEAEAVPFVIGGKIVAHIPVKDLLP
jgi:Uma2 family endonuclease